MAISEAQLEIWAKQGSVTQSSSTYSTIKNVLESHNAPYANRDYSIFLQGSYANDTNIYADSDVDVVISTSSVFYYDIDDLGSIGKSNFASAHPGSANYTYNNFKVEVATHLTNNFGAAVKLGKKAIFIHGNNSRRDVDVLPAAQFRKYFKFNSANDVGFHEGIVFWTSDGIRIVNFPRQHSTNCTTKHQSTGTYFKPCVRILKNMRNRMIDLKLIEDGLAPSYFLEGMLYNVPNGHFGSSYQHTIANALVWLFHSDKKSLRCANERFPLFDPVSPVTWRQEKFDKYLSAALTFWNNPY